MNTLVMFIFSHSLCIEVSTIIELPFTFQVASTMQNFATHLRMVDSKQDNHDKRLQVVQGNTELLRREMHSNTEELKGELQSIKGAILKLARVPFFLKTIIYMYSLRLLFIPFQPLDNVCHVRDDHLFPVTRHGEGSEVNNLNTQVILQITLSILSNRS